MPIKQWKNITKEDLEAIGSDFLASNLLGSYKLYFVDKDTVCKKCYHSKIFYTDGCPHCGYTFLDRDILRQTF